MNLRTPTLAATVLAFLAGARIHAHQRASVPLMPATVAPADQASEGTTAPQAEPTLRFTELSMDIAAAARARLDRPDGRYRSDCSGYVSSVYTEAGVPMDGTVAELHALATERGLLHHHPIPRIGDLAFFDNTHDRNDNGVWDDPLTHIGVVVDVEPDGTAWIAHKGRNYGLVPMNLMLPGVKEAEDGRLINGSLRRYGRSDSWSLYRAGQLWSGFATVEGTDAWYGPSAKVKASR